DGAHALVSQMPRGCADLILVERLQNAAVEQNALADLQAMVAPCQDTRLLRLQIVERVPLLPPKLDDVTEAARRDHPRLGAATDDERVGRDRRAMAEIGDGDALIGAGLHGAQPLRDAAGDAARGVLGRAAYLPHADGLGVAVVEADVREGSTGIHADAQR